MQSKLVMPDSPDFSELALEREVFFAERSIFRCIARDENVVNGAGDDQRDEGDRASARLQQPLLLEVVAPHFGGRLIRHDDESERFVGQKKLP